VWVEAREVGDAVRIEVRDDGPGISDKHRERVFERFYRADPSRSREAGGTGLGLSIVKHLVESMGGEVGVEPNAPRGSIFWLRLPRAAQVTP
jgi:signal transduction histidine kinase